jgi:Zn-dependent protease with chaperone function
MNFFADQENARKNTQKLVILYILTVLVISYFTAWIFFYAAKMQTSDGLLYASQMRLNILTDKIGLYLFLGVTSILLFLSLIKILQIGKGGEFVARCSGASPIDDIPKDPLVKRYQNIVEEMAIASGTPVPRIYIMNNDFSINAFAAGMEIDDCVVAVTRGALFNLNRDELQAVVAHEFGHIFNGDMKIGVRLIGILFGLTCIFESGRILVRSSSESRSSSRRSDKGRGNLVLIGLALMLVGGVGVFLASLLKAAISREREYLADACSVQYTRNPEGLIGAFKKIWAISSEFLLSKNTGTVSHLFFSAGLSSSFFEFSTHPPLGQRIRAINPNFNQKQFEKMELPKLSDELEQGSIRRGAEAQKQKEKDNKNTEKAPPFASSMLNLAQDNLQIIPQSIIDVLYNHEEVLHLLYALLLSRQDDVDRSQQLELLKEVWVNAKIVEGLYEQCEIYGFDKTYLLIDMIIPTLSRLKQSKKELFLKNAKKMLTLSGKFTFLEYSLYTLLKIKMLPAKKSGRRVAQAKCNQAIIILVSTYIELAKIPTDQINTIEERLGTKLRLPGFKKESINYSKISAALNIMPFLNIHRKKVLLTTLEELIHFDGQMTAAEHAILKCTCTALNVPFPALNS